MKDKTVDITIFNNNLNGFNGKRASLEELLDIVKTHSCYISRNGGCRF